MRRGSGRDYPEGSGRSQLGLLRTDRTSPERSSLRAFQWLRSALLALIGACSAAAAVVGELRHARVTSRRMLAHSRRIRKSRPGLNGRPLYEAIVAQHWRLAPDLVAQLISTAEQSCCRWPVARDIRFRDAVNYVVVVSYLRSHPARVGMRADVRRLIARIVPEEL
jgi:hypothetical protein